MKGNGWAEHRNPLGGERNNSAGETFRDTEDVLDFFSFLSQSTHNSEEEEDNDGRSILQGFVLRRLDPRLTSGYLEETCLKGGLTHFVSRNLL